MEAFTTWARTNNKKAFLGEFGLGPNSVCLDALDDMTTFMDKNSDVWLAWYIYIYVYYMVINF